MEPNTDIADAALYAAAETGRALLDALDAEEPFRLLTTIPRKLQELRTIGGRRESTVVSIPLCPSLAPSAPYVGATRGRCCHCSV